MSNNEARQIVQDGLDRRREDRRNREAALEEDARLLRQTISGNHATRTMSEIQKRAQAEAAAKRRREAKLAARAKARALEAAATTATRRYVIACSAVVLVTLLTPFPWYGAMALIPGLAVFPMAYIYRLYVPMGEVKE